MSHRIDSEACPRNKNAQLVRSGGNPGPLPTTIAGLEARAEERETTRREFMKEVEEENQELRRLHTILLQERGSVAVETAVGEGQTVHQELGEWEPGGRSLGAQPERRGLRVEPGVHQHQGGIDEPPQDQENLGVDESRLGLDAKARNVDGLGPTIGVGASMGKRQNHGESIQSLILPRSERRTRPSTGGDEIGGSCRPYHH